MARAKDQQQPDTPLHPKNVNFIIAGKIARVPEGATRRSLTPNDLPFLTDPIEHDFAREAMDAGLLVYPGPEIRAPYPVKNSRGKINQLTMNPDFEVVRLGKKTRYASLVELTKSVKKSAQKHAQKRVAKAAGLTNYYQLRNSDVSPLSHLPRPIKRRSLIDQLGLKKQKKALHSQ